MDDPEKSRVNGVDCFFEMAEKITDDGTRKIEAEPDHELYVRNGGGPVSKRIVDFGKIMAGNIPFVRSENGPQQGSQYQPTEERMKKQ